MRRAARLGRERGRGCGPAHLNLLVTGSKCIFAHCTVDSRAPGPLLELAEGVSRRWRCSAHLDLAHRRALEAAEDHAVHALLVVRAPERPAAQRSVEGWGIAHSHGLELTPCALDLTGTICKHNSEPPVTPCQLWVQLRKFGEHQTPPRDANSTAGGTGPSWRCRRGHSAQLRA